MNKNPLIVYGHTQHFIERAKERFDIDQPDIKDFISDNQNVQDTGLSPIRNRRNLLSDKGILFVVDDDTRRILTCYKSIDPKIHEDVRNDFTTKLKELVASAEVAEAKEIIGGVLPTAKQLVENMEKIATEDVSSDNKVLLDESYDYIAILKHTFNILAKNLEYYSAYEDVTPESSKIPSIKEPVKPFDSPSIKPPQPWTPQVVRPPQITNHELLSDKTPLRDILTPLQRQQLNNFFNSIQKQALASPVLQQIKKGATYTQLTAFVKQQLSVPHYNKFMKELDNML